MELVLDLPPGFPGPGARLVRGPLEPAPCDARAWLQRVLDDAPGEVRVHGMERLQTRLGWPFELYETRAGGQRRAVAVYVFLHFVAAVQVIGDVPPADLREVLASGRPSWRGGGVIALAELWG